MGTGTPRAKQTTEQGRRVLAEWSIFDATERGAYIGTGQVDIDYDQ